MKIYYCILALTLGAMGCGVKGDPQPPLEAATMGRGREEYQKKYEDWRVQENQSATDEEEDKKDESQ